MVMGLAHFHPRHPEKHSARVEIAKNPALELGGEMADAASN